MPAPSCYRTSAKMQPELDRGYVQRVRVTRLGGREVAILDVRMPGETVYLICAAGLGVGSIDRKSRERLRHGIRTSATPEQRTESLWRARFEGASLVRVALQWIDLTRQGHAVRAEAGRGDHLGIGARVIDEDVPCAPCPQAAPRSLLEENGAAIVSKLATLETIGEREALRRALAKAVSKASRRVSAIEGDVARIADAAALAARAQLFVATAAAAPRGTERLSAMDWATGETIELTLDPARGAHEQLNAIFSRAHRLKEGGRIAHARLREAVVSRSALERALSDVADAEETDLASIAERARAAAPRDFKISTSDTPARPGRKTVAARPHPSYRAFLGSSSARILVGRGAAHNDTLTLWIARPHDLWLHAKGAHGAHVIVWLPKGKSCPSELLVEAAHLAAHFSEARGESLVDVQYAQRRHIRKPRGSAPGLVLVDREKVMVLRMDGQILKRLLEAELF